MTAPYRPSYPRRRPWPTPTVRSQQPRPWRLLVVPAFAITLAACGGPSPPGGGPASPGLCPIRVAPVALAIGGRAHAPTPALTPRSWEVVSAVVNATEIGQTSPTLTVVSVDGRSDQTTTGAFSSPKRNTIAVDNDKRQFLASFQTAIAGVRATTPEADVLAALTTAAQAARDPRTGPGTVVVQDSGLSTTAPLDFRSGLLGAAQEEVIEDLVRQDALPDFTGQTVILDGLGYVAPPQEPLAHHRDWLVQLYTKIAHRGGAACVEIASQPRGGASPAGVPPVSPVPVPSLTTITPGGLQPGQAKTIPLPNDHVTGFVPNTPVLLNEKAARQALQPLADWLAANPARTATLVGTTARWGSPESQRDLGRARANKIAELLRHQARVSPSQLATDGAGSDFPEWVNERGPSGEWLLGPAHQNRSVRVTMRDAPPP